METITQKLQQAQSLIGEVLNRNVGTVGFADMPASVLAHKQQLFNGLVNDSKVFDLINAINVLAMANTDVIHIFTSFSGHVGKFSIYAEHVNTDYASESRTRLFDDVVWLEDKTALERLLSIESQLTELIIEAREAAETAAPDSNPYECQHGTILYGTCKRCSDDEKGGEA
ncbi:hypothetical protein [Vibrio alginolyticus]|uniref:hypothetical protein n=1 Tax=Vibrio alginolyticus TaxID=663 RepID=UPI003755009A